MPSWRPTVAVTLCLSFACVALVGEATAQPPGDRAESGRGPLAILIRNPDRSGGAPPYALADQYGQIQRLVEDSPRLDLSQYVGQRVRIRHDTGRTLLASQLDLIGGAARIDPAPVREVAPAQFVPPGRVSRLERRGRSYAVRPAQGEEEPFSNLFDDGVDAEPNADPGPSILPEPPAAADPEPIDLDSLPPSGEVETLEPIPNRTPLYEELPPLRQPEGIHGADCPHCNQPKANATQPYRAPIASSGDYRQTFGRSDRWCGPTCNPPSKRGLYGRAEYLLWWFAPIDTPPLATTNDLGGAPVLGAAGTSILYGGHMLDEESRNGVRLTLGGWLDNQRDIALEGDWLITETESANFTVSDPAGLTVLGRPYYNPAATGGPAEDALIVSQTGTIGGTLGIYTRSEFESLGLRVRTGMCCRNVGGGPAYDCESCSRGGLLGVRSSRPGAISRVDFFTGYRYAKLDETLRFAHDTRVLTGVDAGDTTQASESFVTDNSFHGVDLGFVYDWRSTRWGLELMSRIALGGTTQRVHINGSTTVNEIGTAPVTSAGVLYAQSTNIGSYRRDRFSVLPELSARLSYNITPRLSLSAAYTVVYWANVARPGDQIDYSVDGRLIAGTPVTGNAHPRFDWDETSLWAHGFNFGLDYNY